MSDTGEPLLLYASAMQYLQLPISIRNHSFLVDVHMYRAIIDNIRRYMPDASVSGDAIVGFPGETEEQYLRTEALVREVGFDRVNTAAYSPRPNTPAAEWEHQVADLIKQDRLNRLNKVRPPSKKVQLI